MATRFHLNDSIRLASVHDRFVNTSLSTTREMNGLTGAKRRLETALSRPFRESAGLSVGLGAGAHDEWTNYRVHEIMRLPF